MDLMTVPTPSASPRARRTHDVDDMLFGPPVYDAFGGDAVLRGILQNSDAMWVELSLEDLGRSIGSAELQELARLANQHAPVLRTHDRFGQRLDRVEFHPAYHELLRLAYASKVHSLAWTEQRPGAQVARAALSYLWNQGENGIGPGHVMSFSVIPLLRAHPEVGQNWEPGVLSPHYDPRHLPPGQKRGLTVAMSMTEKQGGSDLRGNETRAEPTANRNEFILNGHKFFCTVPMADFVLLTARTDAGVSLFLAPRLLPDGSHNGIRIQRLKDKLGARSNASSEIEIDGTLAYLLGEDGHGIREFLHRMGHLIRLDFGVASAGIMRRALTLACHHVRHRTAFDHRVADLPQMRNVLADLALEWEASLLLGMRMAAAFDNQQNSSHDSDLLRVGVPVAKYWNCRRANRFVLEALECHGGMGYVEEQPIARLLRDTPVYAFLEGSAAMMGLDFVRSIQRCPQVRDALLTEIREGSSGDVRMKRFTEELSRDFDHGNNDLEPSARRLMGKAALGLQASLMLRHAPTEIAELFVATRLEREGGNEFGTLPSEGALLARIAARAVPE